MTIADDYINQVLGMMPRATPNRDQIAAELRAHIAERLAVGHQESDVLRQLGDPIALAESYLSAEPLVSAPFSARALAKLIDVAGLILVICPTAWLVAQLFPWGWRPMVMILIVGVGGSVLFGMYTVLTEYRYGQTVGKRFQDLRVVRETGAQMSLGQAIVRALPMFLQIYWIDVMFALFTEKSQRAFEMLSKTRVVKAG